MSHSSFMPRADYAVTKKVLHWLMALLIMLDWQKQLAHATHWALYGLIGLLIVSGVFTASAANSVIEPFGLFALDDGMEGNFVGLRQVYQSVIWAISTLIVTHIVAALYHWLWLRDTITQRMLRFWRSEE